MPHALLSASGSHKWLHCPPSARLEAEVPDTSTIFAEEGTLAHAIAAYKLKLWLGQDTSAEDAEIAELAGTYYTGEMERHTDDYAGYVLAHLQEAWKEDPRARLYVESRLDYSRWAPQGFGTGDAVIVSGRVIHIIDLKYGRGVLVDAPENPQLKLYALGALDAYDWYGDTAEVRFTIFQPRRGHIDEWHTTPEALTEWAETEVTPLARLAWMGKGERSAGDWCRFCKVKQTCPAFSMLRLADNPASDFAGFDLG